MGAELLEQEPFDESRREDSFRWSGWDLAVFGVFFALVYLLLSAAAAFLLEDLNNINTTVLVLIQSLMDLVLLGFIVFLVKVVRGRSFLQTIHWRRSHEFSTAYLIGAGIFLAITVMIVSSFFPSAEPTPIEELLKSANNMYLFAFYGIAIAPLVEEVIFRGFVFKVLSDVASPRAAVSLTTVLFTALHIPQLWGNWPAVGVIFAVGYILGTIRGRSGSLIPPFIMHAAYNGLLFVMFAIGTMFEQPA